MPAWRRVDRDRFALLALAAGVVVGTFVILHAGRGLTFYLDEWEFVLHRSGHSPDVFLRPHNEHPSVFPVFIYKVLFETVGLGRYGVYRFVHIALMELLAVLVYVYGRPRIGRWGALFPATALLVVGGLPDYLLQTFELSFTLSLIGVVGTLLAIDARRDGLAIALMILALFSSGIGLTVLPALAAEVLLRPDRRSRLKVLLVPLALYAVWWVPYHVSSFELSNVPYAPRFVEGEYAAGVGALTSLGNLRDAAAFLLAAAAVLVAGGRSGGRARLWFLLLAPLGFWFATAIARYGISTPDTQRYAYPSAVLLAVLVCELGVGRRRPALAPALMAIGGAALVGLVLNNAGLLTTTQTNIPEYTRLLGPELRALELTRGTADPNYAPVIDLTPGITARNYFAALDRYPGSPAGSVAAIERAAPDARAGADRVLIGGLRLTVTALDRPPAGCAPAGTLPISLPGGTLVVDNRRGKVPAAVQVRRFADAPGAALPAIAPGTVGAVTLPPGADPNAYPLLAQIDGRGYTACTTA